MKKSSNENEKSDHEPYVRDVFFKGYEVYPAKVNGGDQKREQSKFGKEVFHDQGAKIDILSLFLFLL